MNIYKIITSLSLFLLITKINAQNLEVSALTAVEGVVLGSAYNSNMESFIGQSCITGQIVSTGSTQATFAFNQISNELQLKKELGLSANARAKFGVYSGKASVDFFKKSIGTEYSISTIWVSNYQFQSKKLELTKKTELGKQLENNFERWNNTCGDYYVNEITYGGKLFFSIRIDFQSKEELSKFKANFSISGPLYGASASLELASKEISRNSKITIIGMQVGGDISKLTQVFGSASGDNIKFVECTLGDITKCTELISNAIRYASNTVDGFPSQLGSEAIPGPSPISYNLSHINSAGIYPNDFKELTKIIKNAREKISMEFDKQYLYSIQLSRLLENNKGNTSRLESLISENTKVEKNIKNLINAATICYDSPNDCYSEMISTFEKIEKFDENVFALPPLAKAEFRLFSTKRGLWTREESVRTMLDTFYFDKENRRFLTKEKLLEFNPDYFITNKSGVFFPSTLPLVAQNINDDISVVLFIFGKDLYQANLFFENVDLSKYELLNENPELRKMVKIPLKIYENAFKEKYNSDGTIIVVRSTRSILGWEDINTALIRDQLRDGDYKRAEGVFYLEVEDFYGRKVTFDLEHHKWMTPEGYSIVSYNWWDVASAGVNTRVQTKYTFTEQIPHSNAYSGQTEPSIPVQTEPPIPEQSEPPLRMI